MKGVIAAGHTLTAEAGAKILEAGGNAFDAAAAAAFAGCACEPTLTGLGAAGFATMHIGSTGEKECLDFFASVPGKNLQHEPCSLQEIEILYGLTPQIYHIGPNSAALPGLVAGILKMHEKHGALCRADILAPAIEIAKKGFFVTGLTAYNFTFVAKILLNTAKGREIFAPKGQVLSDGDFFVQEDLARTLQEIADTGAEGFYRGDIAQEIFSWSKDNGGMITLEDLASYKVSERQPIQGRLGKYDFLCPPPPSSGGVLTAFAFALWNRLAEGVDFQSPEGVHLYLRILQRTSALRGREFDGLLYSSGADLVDKIMSSSTLDRGEADVAQALRPKSPMTTQLSVIDNEGNAVSITTSTGVGSGEMVTNTGMQLSNMLGESDLFPTDYHLAAGDRLTSMMSPMLLMKDGQPFLATGSAGSTRIRSAIFQTTLRALENVEKGNSLADSVKKAVDAPRVHSEGEIVHLEKGVESATAIFLDQQGHMVQKWNEMHLYFGGVNMAGYDGKVFAGAGDIRRGAHSVVV